LLKIPTVQQEIIAVQKTEFCHGRVYNAGAAGWTGAGFSEVLLVKLEYYRPTVGKDIPEKRNSM
jgi:hypothetical protein